MSFSTGCRKCKKCGKMYLISLFDEGLCTECEKAKQDFCSDAISRQYLFDNCVVDSVTMPYVPVNKIKNAPPVTPEMKMGKWILSGGYWRCSECNEKALLKLDEAKGNYKEYMPIRSDFCPNCGAKMVEQSQGRKETSNE